MMNQREINKICPQGQKLSKTRDQCWERDLIHKCQQILILQQDQTQEYQMDQNIEIPTALTQGD